MNIQQEVSVTYGTDDLGANTLLIIGNGFDLDLGLKTRYSDFAKSSFWPFRYRIFGLGGYLNLYQYSDHWFDLEARIAKYCEKSFHKYLPKRIQKRIEEADGRDDAIIIKNLWLYLSEEEKRMHLTQEYNDNSVACRLLKDVCTSLIPGSIYSFNYTDLKQLSLDLGKDVAVGCNPIYVHGTLKERDIILGFNDGRRVVDYYNRFVKYRRKDYTPSSLFDAIEKYSTIIFFGLSFGEIDTPYFSGFFDRFLRGELKDKCVRIITRNNESRQEVMTNLSIMTKSNLSLYKGFNLEVITTDGSMTKQLTDLFSHLESRATASNFSIV